MKPNFPGEFKWIRYLKKANPREVPGVVLGIGDDAAVLSFGGKRLLVTTDLLIDGIHFRSAWASLREIGQKAMSVNLSDIAAMGGRPRWAVVSVGLPRGFGFRKASQLFDGLQRVARRAGVVLVGGDTNASPRLVVNVTLIGEAPHGTLTRTGARVGDRIYVTGSIGGSALGLVALKRGRRRGSEKFIRSHRMPPHRVDVGLMLARRRLASSMIDVSDGLLGDLDHILEASRVGATLCVNRLPAPAGFFPAARKLGMDPRRLQLTGGEDYELLFTVPRRVIVKPQIAGVRISEIGTIGPRSWGIRLIDREGRRLPVPSRLGFSHF